MNRIRLIAAAAMINLAGNSLSAITNSTGTPLGGIGASYIVYNARTGGFAKGYRLTGNHWYTEKSVPGGFHLYTRVNGTAATSVKATTVDEDAQPPIYRAHYAALQNVKFDLLAFGPYATGDDSAATFPLAFFEFTVTNNNSVSAEAAVALDIDGLVGSAPVRIDGGFSTQGAENASVIAAAAASGAQVTAGSSVSDFSADGVLDNSNGHLVAVMAIVGPGQKAVFRFVVAWYQNFGSEGFYYQNYFAASSPAASWGMANFSRIRAGATAIVDRIMGSNLPSWFNNYILENLYPLMHNGQTAKDGRVAFREGTYHIIGTLDQMGHAQLPVSYNWPSINWRQMEYFARTQMRAPAEGAIHHDFGTNESMCAWDARDASDGHYDYAPQYGGISTWGDLNALFVLNIYELFLATGDTTKLRMLWPYMKKTGAWMLVQCSWGGAGSYLPMNVAATYDDGHNDKDIYCSSLFLAACSAFKEMASAMNDLAARDKWAMQFANGRNQFVQRYWTSQYFLQHPDYDAAGGYGGDGLGTEQYGAGYALARALGLPSILDDDKAQYWFRRVYPVVNFAGRMSCCWHFYEVGHAGQCGIAIGSPDSGLDVHNVDYSEYHTKNPQWVFWQGISNMQGYYSYCTAPVVWRALFLLEGYTIDNFNKRLWLRPALLKTMQNRLTNAPLLLPGNWGTFNYNGNDSAGRTQDLIVAYDKSLTMREIVLRNNTGGTSAASLVIKNGVAIAHTDSCEGTGLDAIVRIKLSQPVDLGAGGVRVLLYKNKSQLPTVGAIADNRDAPMPRPQLQVLSTDRITVTCSSPATLVVDLFSMDGRLVQSITKGLLGSGTHAFPINSRLLSDGAYVIRLTGSGIDRTVRMLVRN